MTLGIALDVLLIAIVALYAPLGGWRGAAREALLGGSILLGAATATGLAASWGYGLGGVTGVSDGTGAFCVAIALLLLGVAVGYGSGPLLGNRPPALESRAVGGVLGALNAVVLLGYALTFVVRFLGDGEVADPIASGVFAEALVEHLGWFLLAAFAVIGATVGVARLAFRFDDDLIERSEEPSPARVPTGSRHRSVVVPNDPDGGKVEPDRPEGGRAGRAPLARGAFADIRVASRASDPPRFPSEDRIAPPGWAGRRADLVSPVPERDPSPASLEGPAVIDAWLRRAAGSGDDHRADPARGQGSARSSDATAASSEPVSFTGASLRDLLDPPKQPGSSTWPEANRAFLSDESGSHPSRACPICGTPAAPEADRCGLCGEKL